jgi:hypothetical protein
VTERDREIETETDRESERANFGTFMNKMFTVNVLIVYFTFVYYLFNFFFKSNANKDLKLN